MGQQISNSFGRASLVKRFLHGSHGKFTHLSNDTRCTLVDVTTDAFGRLFDGAEGDEEREVCSVEKQINTEKV